MDILIYIMLGLTSVVGLTFIVERALALRWSKVAPPEITAVLAACRSHDDVKKLSRICEENPSTLGRLLLLAADHLDWPPEFADEIWQDWERKNEEQFGDDWPTVQGIIGDFEEMGIFLLDPSPSNIRFR